MARFVGIVLALMVGLTLVGFALAHFALAVALVVVVLLVGRYLHRHGA